jgi:CubicO group peptidase (beta-lactamase class C family)
VSGLPRSAAVEQGVDPGAVLAFVDAVDTDPATELHSLMVLRHGHVVAEGWWAPHTPERSRLLYSLSKSFTSTALGFAVAEGLVALDDTAASYFPELDGEVLDPRSRAITLRHLAAMASGHDHDMLDDAQARDPDGLVRGFLLVPPDEPPGSLFAYSQPCTYTLAAIIQRRTGERLSEYLRPRLLDPLGIGDVRWQQRPEGQDLGFSGLFARTEDVARLGQLWLQRGRWGEDQLLPEWYVAAAASPQIGTPAMEHVDWRQGYGYQFWMSRHGYRGDGAFGQFCLVLPEHDAVVALTAGTEETQRVLDHVWDHLLPGLGSDSPDEGVQPDLEERLRGLHLQTPRARPSPERWGDWTGAPFPVTPAKDPATGALLTSVGVARADDRLTVTVGEPDNTVTFPVATGEWLVSEPRDAQGDVVPVAASGGWRDGQTLVVEVLFLETPHRMVVV